MSEFDLDELIYSAVAQAGNVDRARVNADTRLIDLHIDSLAFVSVIAQVEAVCEVELTTDEILSLLWLPTIADAVTRVREILSSRAVWPGDGRGVDTESRR